MAVNLLFETAVMKLTDNLGNTVAGGERLACQLDTVNIPLNMEAQGMIPTDWYDLYSIGWTSPVPTRSNYFVDLATGTQYSVFGNVAVYQDHLEVRLTRYTGPN